MESTRETGACRRPQRVYGLPLPASGTGLPPHAPAHVVPAAQSCDLPPLQLMWHAVEPPHSTEHMVLPWQSTVQPPAGHLMAQVLLPVHVSVEPVPSEMLQSLPPPQVTVLFVPVVRLQVLVPSQVDVQFEEHVPAHVDLPAQSVVQPVPHVESHMFMVLQSNVTLLGGAAAPPLEPLAPPSAPASPPAALPLATPPNEQVPPALHVHVVPEQSQAPVQDGLGMAAASLLPQPVAAPAPMAPAAETPSATKASENRRFVMDPSVPRSGPYQTQTC